MHLPLESTYFAYGSNMDKEQMAVRCPGKPKPGYLEKILESANKYGFSSDYEEVIKSYF